MRVFAWERNLSFFLCFLSAAATGPDADARQLKEANGIAAGPVYQSTHPTRTRFAQGDASWGGSDEWMRLWNRLFELLAFV